MGVLLFCSDETVLLHLYEYAYSCSLFLYHQFKKEILAINDAYDVLTFVIKCTKLTDLL